MFVFLGVKPNIYNDALLMSFRMGNYYSLKHRL